MKKIWFSLFSIITVQTAFANPCHHTRGVIDIGSGSTKAKVAVVDTCLQKIVSVVMEEQTQKVAYSADLKAQKIKGLEGFSKEIEVDGLRAIRQLLALGFRREKNIEWRGFATSAFRVSKNGRALLRQWSEILRIPLQIIEQQTEGEFGFAAGIQVSRQTNLDRTLVWDIGAGSQQFSYLRNGKVEVLRLEDEASEKFKELILSQIKKITDFKRKSPNPIGTENLTISEDLACEMAAKVNLPFNPEEIIGIGGVHSRAILDAIGKREVYGKEDLDALLPTLVLKTDQELNSPYADTLVSNVIMVRGFMEKLQFNRIRVSHFGTADGALVRPDFWN